MRLLQVRLKDFRCIAAAKLDLGPEINWIVGQNASGKTSLLEALFFLGHGRSFRTRQPDRLIRTGARGFEIVARLGDENRSQVLGVARHEERTEVRFAGQKVGSMAEVAKVLPVVALDADMNQLVSGGPVERRRWLDWGVFHVEQSYLPAWRDFQQALKQRNTALRSGATDRALIPWTRAVIQSGENIAELRKQHFARLLPRLSEYSRAALPEVEVNLSLRAGWPEGETLEEALTRQLARDRETGSTRAGPHRGDVSLRVNGLPAEDQLSRGQQKMLAGALWLAQVNVFSERTHRKATLLVDDLAAELDGVRLDRFLRLLEEQSAQKILTAIADADVVRTGLTGGKVFHVEHGAVADE